MYYESCGGFREMKHEFEIKEIYGKEMKPTGRFQLVIKGDFYHKARALIYDEFVAQELAEQLKIRVWKSKMRNVQ